MIEDFVLLTFITSLFVLIIISALLRVIITVFVPFESVKWAFFFPGVLIHEGAHAGVSKLLGVPVLEINFKQGYVQIDPEAPDSLKRVLIGISPLFFCFVIGSALFLVSLSFLAAERWVLGIILVFIGISIFAQASPSPKDIANFLHGEAESVTVAVWVLVCGILGFFTILEQPFGVFESFKQTHLEEIAVIGSFLTASLGYLIYRVATRSERERKGKEWAW